MRVRKHIKLHQNNDAKASAHSVNIEVWKNLSGRNSFSSNEEYWTLVQTPSESREVPDLLSVGLLSSVSQVHGVNRDPVPLAACKQVYPGLHTYKFEWRMAMYRHTPCPSGGIVYLDSCTQIDAGGYREASTDTLKTLEACGPDTLVCANFCLITSAGVRKVFETDTYRANVQQALKEEHRSRWSEVELDWGSGPEFGYQPPMTNHTQMVTLFYWSGN